MTDWSPFKPEVMHDPGPSHQSLLSQCPVHRCDDFEPPFYTLSRYEDVKEALRDYETFSAALGQYPTVMELGGMFSDPPEHTFYRKLLQSWFSPRAVEELRTAVTKLTNELIDNIRSGNGEFDLHDDFAFPLPVIIIADLLGVPKSDIHRFKHWSDQLTEMSGSQYPEQYSEMQQEFMDYMGSLLMQRRSEIQSGETVPHDLMSLVAGARTADGEYAPASDCLSVVNQLLVGGNETTTSLIANLMWRLLEVPERWQMILEEETLIASAIEESLRFDPPVLGLCRGTTREVTLHGKTIPADTRVYLNYAAANRDPSVFSDPDSFDITRAPNKHLAFGLGIHKCIGAPTARLEAEVAIKALRERLPKLTLLGSGERIAPFFLWGRRKLPVAWS